MKKTYALLIIFSVSLQYAARAESPCVTTFAIEYALAEAEYASDCDFCSHNSGPFLGPCMQEAQEKYNNAIHELTANYSACCCAHELSCCN